MAHVITICYIEFDSFVKRKTTNEAGTGPAPRKRSLTTYIAPLVFSTLVMYDVYGIAFAGGRRLVDGAAGREPP